MNVAYHRTRTSGFPDNLTRPVDSAEGQGREVLGHVNLPRIRGKVVPLRRPDWMEVVVGADRQLAGLLPCSVVVDPTGDEVQLGSGGPALLASVAGNAEIARLASETGDAIRRRIEGVAGVKPLRPTSVRLYSSTTCPHCTMEASSLESEVEPRIPPTR